MNLQQLNDINNDGEDIEEEVDNIMLELQKEVKIKKQREKQDSSRKFVDDTDHLNQDSVRPPSVLFQKY